MKNNDIKFRIIISLLTLLFTAACAVISVFTALETTSVKIIGALASVAVVTAVTWKFPRRFYLLAMVFDIFAAAMGSVINLYHYIGFYDRFVHYLSGILLAEGGMLIISFILEKRKIEKDHIIMLLFSFFFSSSCAGFWEIYEFTADNILNINMQGTNTNTMGDIVSGVLGAATYFIASILILKREKNK
ncbi:hypothetical protein [Porcipelethomonas sp.]|uniref:hypothetical protein n=1 Tax=Porcipelethomonas sp. TaxID=2981675 RepID=UPI003EF80951